MSSPLSHNHIPRARLPQRVLRSSFLSWNVPLGGRRVVPKIRKLKETYWAQQVMSPPPPQLYMHAINPCWGRDTSTELTANWAGSSRGAAFMSITHVLFRDAASFESVTPMISLVTKLDLSRLFDLLVAPCLGCKCTCSYLPRRNHTTDGQD